MQASNELTFIVIPLLGGDALATCLDALPLGCAECIVVLRRNTDELSLWTARYPSVKFAEVDDVPVPLRRQRGVELARNDVVALIEDTTLPDPGWHEAVISAFADPTVVGAGGPVVVSAALPNRFQALGWTEYGAFQAARWKSASAGGVSRLPGNNIAFRRKELLAVFDGRSDGLAEAPICEMLRAKGLRLI